MSDLSPAGQVNYYKTLTNDSEISLRVEVVIRKGPVSKTDDCKIISLVLEKGESIRKFLPAECNSYNMPFLNRIIASYENGDNPVEFSATDSDWDAIMNKNHTLHFQVENAVIKMFGENPSQ